MSSQSLLGPEHTKHRFLVLDGMQGLAAIMVVSLHTRALIGPEFRNDHAFLAVDFFFLLSGFVISYAYGRKLDEGLSSWNFLKARFARLYPLYALGLVLGSVAWLDSNRHVLFQQQFLQQIFRFGANAFFIPFPRPNRWAFLFNFPTWSLAGELAANIVHAFFLRSRSTRHLLWWLGVSGVLLWAVVAHFGNADFGAVNREVLVVLPRVLFSYVFGMILERFWSASKVRFRVPAIVPFAMLFAVLSLSFTKHQVAEQMLLIVFFLPALLLLSAYATVGKVMKGPSGVLGLISYPLYILHIPLFTFFQIHKLPVTAPHMTMSSVSHWLVLLLAGVLISLAAEFWYDRPIRTYLRNRIVSPPAHA